MLILAVETSGPELSAALVRDDVILAERAAGATGFMHSERLMPMVASLLGDAGLTVRDIDVFAASSGPGSFTGVRIGIVCMKSMAYTLGKPTAGVPTLDILAMNAAGANGCEPDVRICALIDARNDQVYSGIYRCSNGILYPDGEYEAGPVGAVAAKLSASTIPTVLVGSGAAKHRDMLAGSSSWITFPDTPGSDVPHAASAGILARRMALAGMLVKAEDLVPLYVRKSQAERSRENAGYHG